jgi:hypothetical protein
MAEIQKTQAKSGWKGAWPKLLATRSISTWDLAGVSLVAAERKQTLDLLKKAADERLSQVIFLQVDPRFDSLHSDVRFQNLVQQLGLLP